jgi:hypothetical protein
MIHNGNTAVIISSYQTTISDCLHHLLHTIIKFSFWEEPPVYHYLCWHSQVSDSQKFLVFFCGSCAWLWGFGGEGQTGTNRETRAAASHLEVGFYKQQICLSNHKGKKLFTSKSCRKFWTMFSGLVCKHKVITTCMLCTASEPSMAAPVFICVCSIGLWKRTLLSDFRWTCIIPHRNSVWVECTLDTYIIWGAMHVWLI